MTFFMVAAGIYAFIAIAVYVAAAHELVTRDELTRIQWRRAMIAAIPRSLIWPYYTGLSYGKSLKEPK